MNDWNTMWMSLQNSMGVHIPQVLGALAIFIIGWFVAALVKAGATVQVVMTDAATHFITPVTMQALSGRPVCRFQSVTVAPRVRAPASST